MRPSWQIDLKWMLGLAAYALVIAACGLYSLSHFTSRDTAIPIASALVSAGINDRITDAEFAQVQATASTNPSGTVTVSPVSLSMVGSEIVGMDKQATSAVVGNKLAAVMYDNGEAAAKSLIVTPSPETGQEPVKLGPVGALTSSNHDLFMQLFMATAVLALLALGGVAMMARGWGRLGAPTFIAALSTAPFAAIWVFGKGVLGTGDPGESLFAQNARSAFDGAASDLSTLFLAISVAAFVLGLLSVLGSAVSLAVVKATPEETSESEPKPVAPAVPTTPKINVPRPQGAQPQGLVRASASLAATTYRVTGTTQVVPKSESPSSGSQQNVA
jgi:hypothetical protein